jgi:GT2 family glycosyltransferase
MPYFLIVSEGKQCVAKNRNAGLIALTNERILFVDDDVLPPEGFLSRMSKVLDDETIGVVSAQMTGPNGEQQNNLYGIPAGEIRDCVPPGTCFMYDRSRLDGCSFDEGYECSQWEDTDFMVQVKRVGLRTVAIGDVCVIHDNNWGRNTARTWQANRRRFMSKWPDEATEMGL